MGLLPYIRICIYVYGHVYLRILNVMHTTHIFQTMERRCGQFSVTNCRNVVAMLGCRCDVSAFDLRRLMCRPSKIDDRCVDLRRSMRRLSKIDDRCVDLRGSMIDVSTFEDG